ncbi:MAG: heme ABC exporter, ATP-binding protein CcmA [Rhodospirillales bacterium RIFCSPLOWO2_12_FULL_58_28]|nr:MAG: heme ABC exporter, ATP-binding protein CcmA [Rhodospirillales bacterium RIFCSPLOWO2_02_FULL_58_16]OHC77961.1 MAG: heme ABC exporter, ATP-binding protein CcmA [Rhodospirillales bacterium RIFCSPLOWO2_12_FULL_58_28]
MSIFTGHELVCIRGERCVFSGLSFSVSSGGALVLTGPNGSGKSSLLRLMAGLLRPAAGVIAWDGEKTTDEPELHNGRLHYVGHLDAVKPVLSVAENLNFWAVLKSKTGNADAATAAALETFGLSYLADVPGKFLSAGQKRRVNLARLSASPAFLWLLDEPTTALDVKAVAALEAAIAEHRSGGGMVVVSTHARIAMDGAETLDIKEFSRRPDPRYVDQGKAA